MINVCIPKVCEDDDIEVKVWNRLGNSEGTSIHWHALHLPGTPYMDGSAMITQCPISPQASFTYKFKVYRMILYTNQRNSMLCIWRPCVLVNYHQNIKLILLFYDGKRIRKFSVNFTQLPRTVLHVFLIYISLLFHILSLATVDLHLV